LRETRGSAGRTALTRSNFYRVVGRRRLPKKGVWARHRASRKIAPSRRWSGFGGGPMSCRGTAFRVFLPIARPKVCPGRIFFCRWAAPPPPRRAPFVRQNHRCGGIKDQPGEKWPDAGRDVFPHRQTCPPGQKKKAGGLATAGPSIPFKRSGFHPAAPARPGPSNPANPARGHAWISACGRRVAAWRAPGPSTTNLFRAALSAVRERAPRTKFKNARSALSSAFGASFLEAGTPNGGIVDRTPELANKIRFSRPGRAFLMLLLGSRLCQSAARPKSARLTIVFVSQALAGTDQFEW